MGTVEARKNTKGQPPKRSVRNESPKVLVVDDDREITYLLANALQRWGYVAVQANSAAEAIQKAREETIDAALIDVRIPDTDGFRLLQALKEGDEHLVAVMMTGYGDLDGARRAMKLGAHDYMTKPFDMRTLRAVLQAGLKERVAARVQRVRTAAASATFTPSGR